MRKVLLLICILFFPLTIEAQVTFRACHAGTSFTTTTSPVVTVPAGVADGDFLVFFLATNAQATNGAGYPPSGWTLLAKVANGADNDTYGFYRVASSEPASYTLTNFFSATTESGRISMCAWSGINTSDPLAGSVVTGTTASGTNHVTGSITPDMDNTMVIAIWGMDNGTDPTTGTAAGSPTPTERHDSYNTTSGMIYLTEYAQTTAAAVTQAFTSSAADTTSNMIFAVNKAAAASTRHVSVHVNP